MKVGLIGTGAISHKHAQVYRNIGFQVTVCTDVNEEYGKKFAQQYGCEFVPTYEELCVHPDVDYVDVCTFPDFRLQPLEICAAHGKHIQVQKPISVDLKTAQEMVRVARDGGILLSVVSQHRFDDSSLFLEKAIADGRLGKLLQIDAYVKWFRSAEYFSRPIKGSWAVEGGGALINQAVHQIDIMRWLGGPVKQVTGEWQLGALHKIESEDILNAMLRFESGVTGVIQASTAVWPGDSERIEIHGTKGTAVITGDQLTTWDVQDDQGDAAPLSSNVESGSSDPMAIPLTSFERQFLEFADAIKNKRKPRVAGEEGLAALEVVDAIYRSCRTGEKITL
jgi:UDP-N-acetyl-2-amino-2-deoxyglucuronate dehydrogenase